MKRLRMVIGVALICGCLQLAAASPAGAASLTLTVDGTTGVAIGTGSSVHLLVRASGQRIGNTAVLESLSHGQYKELTQCQIQVPALRVLGSCTYDYTGEEPGTVDFIVWMWNPVYQQYTSHSNEVRVVFHGPAAAPDDLTLTLSDGVAAIADKNLKSGLEAYSGVFLYGDNNVYPDQVMAGTTFKATVEVNGHLQEGQFIAVYAYGSTKAICSATGTENHCTATITEPVTNVGVTGDIGNAYGTEGVTMTVATDPLCSTDPIVPASTRGGSCPGPLRYTRD